MTISDGMIRDIMKIYKDNIGVIWLGQGKVVLWILINSEIIFDQYSSCSWILEFKPRITTILYEVKGV